MRADARKNYDHLLEVARAVVAEQGAEASLRDIARRAGVGLATLYRHFPTREALLDTLLRSSFDDLTARAVQLAGSTSPGEALDTWLRECVALTVEVRGMTELMVAAMEDPDSALYASCKGLRAAGAGLLVAAQTEGDARDDIDGTDLMALINAIAWLGEQPALADRAGRLLEIIAGAVTTR